MKQNKPHIATLVDLLKELQNIETNEQKRVLLETIKGIQTDDESLVGAVLFLKDHDWDFDQLKNTLHKKSLRRNANNNETSNLKWRMSKFKYAAVFIGLLGLLGSYYLNSNNSSIDRFYVEEPGLPNFMNDTKPDKWSEPMAYFKNGDYRSALVLLNANKIEADNDTLLYFKAVSNYKLGHYQESLSLFKKQLDHLKSSFIYDTEFRIGFVWYKAGDSKRAQQQFISIAKNKDHPYNEEAKLILNEIF